jgi:hypothetical protein
MAPIDVARTNKGADWVIEELTYAAFGMPTLPTKGGGKAPSPKVLSRPSVSWQIQLEPPRFHYRYL